MDQILDPRRLTRAAPLIGFVLGAAIALLIAILPQWRLEAAVSASGIDAFLSAARPPLGATARSALALASGVVVAGAVAGVLLLAARWLPGRQASDPDVPVLRRADAHPDAPSRRPLRANEDLGQPLPIAAVAAPPSEAVAEPMVLRTVPADLDTPLAAVDPAAIPQTPREPVRPVAPLVRLAPAPVLEETIETFELTPIRRAPRPAPAPEPVRATSLATLLDRLEQGAARRGARPAPSIEDTLGMLRGLATR
jgi:hypothetical protein